MIRGYFGRERQGKTFSMVKDAAHQAKGRIVYSNFHLNIPGADCRLLNNPYEIIDLRDCLLLLDEIWVWFPAFLWKDIPTKFLWRLGQQGKRGVDMYYTSQFPGRVFKTIRELTWESIYHEKWFNWIRAKIYEPDFLGSSKMDVVASRWIRIDEKYGNMYDTHEEVEWVWDDEPERKGKSSFFNLEEVF